MDEKLLLCDECGSSITETTTHYVCPSCGLIKGQIYTQGTFTSIETANSFGNQFVDIANKKSLVNGGSGSFVDYYGTWRLNDYAGKRIDQNNSFRYARLKKINDYYSQNSGQLKLYRALHLINRIHGNLDLPDSIKEEASKIYRLSYQKVQNQIRIPIFVPACIYLATRLMNYNLLLKDILISCEKLNLIVKGKTLIAAASEIKSTLKLQIRATRPEEYLEKTIISLCNNLEVIKRLRNNHIGSYEYSIKLRQISNKILNELTINKRGGRNPFILAAASVAGADIIISKTLGKKRGLSTQKLVAKSCNIQEYTLREHFIKIIKPIINSIY